MYNQHSAKNYTGLVTKQTAEMECFN